MGLMATTIWIVLQLGLAIILSFSVSTPPFTSGTIKGILSVMRQADELSMTVQPTAANFGAHSLETAAPAENKAISGFALTASSMEITEYSEPSKVTFRPTEFSEATGNNSVTGNFLSSSTFSMIWPTRPVEPTTATFISLGDHYIW